MTKSTKKNLTPKCPTCEKALDAKNIDKTFLPFCSKHCKMVDLGHWFGEYYKVPESRDNPDEKDED